MADRETDVGGSELETDAPSSSAQQKKSPHGALQIIEALEGVHEFRLAEEVLESVLLDPRVADKQVAVVSVAGAFRKGKSFLLNFFLRYLQQLEAGNSEWLETDSQLVGFSWRGGADRETNGILIWPHPFVIKRPDGQEVAVLLMDTQGTFDSQSTVKDCATIFALSTMISSVQIYNLSANIQEDDLQHLQLFTEYGRLALDNSNAKPFQTLLFLVRDWCYPYEAEYGFQGGQRILDRRLQVSDRQHPELQQLREHIRSCFENIQCFLMPHPGLKVATNPHFKGELQEIEDEFKVQLRSLVPRILSPPNIRMKEVNGNRVTCRELLYYFRAYIKIFQGEELPEPKSMLMATAEANNLAAVSQARAQYSRAMEEVCGGDTPYMATNDLVGEHERCREEAMLAFKGIRKMGGAEFSAAFLEKLDDEIFVGAGYYFLEAYENFVRVNEGKNLFKSMRTPAVLFVLLVVDYILQEICQLLYLNVFATMFSSLLGGVIMTLILWAYARYSGNFREAGQAIDDLAEWVWVNVLQPMTTEGVKKVAVLHQRFSENNVTSATSAARQRMKRD